MMEDSPNNPLESMPFSYRNFKNGTVSISYKNKEITILKNKAADKFCARIETVEGIDAQLIMAKATGNFKHGNEREAKESGP